MITNKEIPNRRSVTDLIDSLDSAFESNNCEKADIVKIKINFTKYDLKAGNKKEDFKLDNFITNEK